MSLNPVRVEIVGVGFIILLGLFFWGMFLIGIEDFTFLVSYDKYLPYLTIIATIISYILGISTHRVSQVLSQTLRKLLAKQRRVRLHEYYKDPEAAVFESIVYVWQYGNERLHKGLDYHFTLLSFFRLTAIGVALLGSGLTLWLFRVENVVYALWALFFSLVLFVLFFLALRRQRVILKLVEEPAIKEIKAMRLRKGKKQ